MSYYCRQLISFCSEASLLTTACYQYAKVLFFIEMLKTTTYLLYRHFLMPLAYDVIVKRMMQNGRKVMGGECKRNVKLHKYTKK